MVHPTQRYVAFDLTHFVGRSLRESEEDRVGAEEAQFRLLLRILREGTLRAGGVPGLTGGAFPSGGHVTLWNPHEKISDGGMYYVTAVCFCDIPVSDLHIHMSKYSRFGLAFSKDFLVRKGANPVYYVARQARVPGPYGQIGSYESLGEKFDRLVADWIKGSNEVHRPSDADSKDGKALGAQIMRLTEMGTYLFGFVKCFDAEAAETAEHNFYMEREWRVLGDVSFSLGDVRRVVVPRPFFARFRGEVPDYHGELLAAPLLPDRPAV